MIIVIIHMRTNLCYQIIQTRHFYKIAQACRTGYRLICHPRHQFIPLYVALLMVWCRISCFSLCSIIFITPFLVTRIRTEGNKQKMCVCKIYYLHLHRKVDIWSNKCHLIFSLCKCLGPLILVCIFICSLCQTLTLLERRIFEWFLLLYLKCYVQYFVNNCFVPFNFWTCFVLPRIYAF